ncbi:AAA family ATPase [Pseudomonas sp. RL_105y_Pfl1_103]|uniref:AAA family ATPase n=1 Tax=Pseudomonas sp. RL_105y_Pfl1_103 TaxID=3088707 RepID=UPI0030D6F689
MSELFDVKELERRWGMQAILEAYERKPNWIFKDFMEKGEQWLISGAPKAGKSRLALQLAIAASEGTSFLGNECVEKQRVLYVDFELAERLSAERVVIMHEYDLARLRKNPKFFKCCDYVAVNLSDEQSVGELRGKIKAFAPDLIIFDVLARMHGEDENSNPAMASVMLKLRELSNGAAHIIVHHARKETHGNGGAKAIRGASSIHGEVDGVISLAQEKSAKGTHSVVYSMRGAKEPGKQWLIGDDLAFKVSQSEASSPEEMDQGQITSILLKIFTDVTRLKSGELKERLATSTKIDERQAARKMKEAVTTGMLVVKKEGRFSWYSMAP